MLYSSCAGGDCVYFSCLICRGEKTSSRFFFFFIFLFFSPKPGLRGGDKSLLFSVAKRTTGGFSTIYRPGRGGGDEKRGEDRRGSGG